MPVDQIIQALIQERDRIQRAIDALQGPTKRRGRPPKNALGNAPEWVAGSAPAAKKTRGGRTFTPEQKAQQAERMRLMWAKRKKAAKKKAAD